MSFSEFFINAILILLLCVVLHNQLTTQEFIREIRSSSGDYIGGGDVYESNASESPTTEDEDYRGDYCCNDSVDNNDVYIDEKNDVTP
jgi:hypothetical protein